MRRGRSRCGSTLFRPSLAALACTMSCLMLTAAPTASAEDTEREAAALFDRISDDPVLLRVFLRDMPKGGDLHNHASGTPFAEEYLSWAEDRAFCVTEVPAAISPPPCEDEGEITAVGLMRTDPALYAEIVDALSVREVLADVDIDRSGHEQFFGSFERFFPIVSEEPDRTLASIKQLAADDRLSYVELMFNPGTINQYTVQSEDGDWDESDLDAAFSRFAPEIDALVEAGIQQRDKTEREAAEILSCGTADAEPGCDVTVYYNFYGLRLLPNEQLFRQLALGFALIEADPRFLGVSLVQPEDDPRAIENYQLHMRMIAFLNEKYPSAKVSLHAGELTLGLAPAYALRSHIRDAIEIAGSSRIGHGIDIAWELDSRKTLDRMAEERIAVEINLSSNDIILGVRGKEHPLNLYRASGVPIVLSTDDQGVLRTDMTEQYVRAALEHGLAYRDLKQAARNSLEFAFLPGTSIWKPGQPGTPSPTCQSVASRSCRALALFSPKALLQLKLEDDFEAFEKDIAGWTIAQPE
ncbi:adenosine deaminase [Henriciella mobilis]|uniref:adenosine deaminase n=2 Tax=Henriciella mobilis TaxID=2305467 RepID=A0A399RRW6_9PROT|nr:adenosine deaminase [Henriciella mobilis]